MYSRAAGWNDGSKVWEIEHDSDLGIGHLETSGDLPPSFPSIRDHLRSQQEEHGGDAADTDYIFDIPVEVAAALTGYRYDADAWGRNDAFEVLVTTSPSAPARRESRPWRKNGGAYGGRTVEFAFPTKSELDPLFERTWGVVSDEEKVACAPLLGQVRSVKTESEPSFTTDKT